MHLDAHWTPPPPPPTSCARGAGRVPPAPRPAADAHTLICYDWYLPVDLSALITTIWLGFGSVAARPVVTRHFSPGDADAALARAAGLAGAVALPRLVAPSP